jgi:hypothetical protein
VLTTRSFALAAIVAASAACSTHSAAAPVPANALAVVPGVARYLTASGGYLYWALVESYGAQPETWSIERISEGGGGSVERLAENVPPPFGLAVDGTNAYWTDVAGGRLFVVPVSGAPSGAAPTVIASNLTGPSAVVVAGGAVYVENGNGSGFDAELLRVPLDGGANSTVQSKGVRQLASDGKSVYFTEIEPAPGPLGLGIGVYAYDGEGAPRQLLPPTQIIEEIAVDGGYLYALAVADPTSNTSLDDVVRVPLAGGASVTLASEIPTSTNLGAASGSVYWSSGNGVWTVPGTGGTPSEFSKDNALEFASDGGLLFAVAPYDADDTVIVDESR